MINYCYQKNKFILIQISQFENCELFKIFGFNQSLYHFNLLMVNFTGQTINLKQDLEIFSKELIYIG